MLGPCSPWSSVLDLLERDSLADIDAGILADAVQAASEILYALSGRQFSGECTSYVRPTARRHGWSSRSWGAAGGFGWYTSWGSCGSAWGSGVGAAAAWLDHSCACSPQEVELGAYPVTEIVEVKINGTVIPAEEYRIDDRRLLVRVRPTAAAIPTEQAGWPTCQRLDLPDTEPGTFSVTFLHGTLPPTSGKRAATALAAELALALAGDPNTRLPERVTSIVRQGESITLIDPQNVLDKGRTGIPEVDLFVKSVNPAGLARRASVWSPDLGRARRPG